MFGTIPDYERNAKCTYCERLVKWRGQVNADMVWCPGCGAIFCPELKLPKGDIPYLRAGELLVMRGTDD